MHWGPIPATALKGNASRVTIRNSILQDSKPIPPPTDYWLHYLTLSLCFLCCCLFNPISGQGFTEGFCSTLAHSASQLAIESLTPYSGTWSQPGWRSLLQLRWYQPQIPVLFFVSNVFSLPLNKATKAGELRTRAQPSAAQPRAAARHSPRAQMHPHHHHHHQPRSPAVSSLPHQAQNQGSEQPSNLFPSLI